jgi:hypothetical protein
VTLGSLVSLISCGYSLEVSIVKLYVNWSVTYLHVRASSMAIYPSVHLLIDSFADVEVSGIVEGRKVNPADEALCTWSRLTPSAVPKYVDWGSMIYSCWSMYRRRRISVALIEFKVSLENVSNPFVVRVPTTSYLRTMIMCWMPTSKDGIESRS